MALFALSIWIIAITSFTLLGSLYAKKSNKPDLLIALYVTFVLVSQILAAKICVFDLGFREFVAPSAILVFSVTYLITDIVNEKFGKNQTHRMIFIGFTTQVAATLFFWLSTKLSPAPSWNLQSAWQNIFSLVPRITFASWIAFLVSENLDAIIFSWFKKKTNGKYLWIRNAFSSIPSLAIDSFIFIFLAFYGIYPIWALIFGQITIKWFIGLINIPFMYFNKWLLNSSKNEQRANS